MFPVLGERDESGGARVLAYGEQFVAGGKTPNMHGACDRYCGNTSAVVVERSGPYHGRGEVIGVVQRVLERARIHLPDAAPVVCSARGEQLPVRGVDDELNGPGRLVMILKQLGSFVRSCVPYPDSTAVRT